jgi:hypothetical protein
LILDSFDTRLGLFVKSVGAFGTAAGKAFQSSIVAEMGKSIPGVQAIIDRIAQMMGSLTQTASNRGFATGSSFGQGMWQGMSAWLQPIMDKAAQLVNDAEASARNAADAKSPSRKMRRFGQDWGMGAVLGVQDMIPAFADATGRFSAAGIGSAYSGVHTGPVGGARAATQVVQHVYQVTPEDLQKLMEDARYGVEVIEALVEEGEVT